MSLPNKELSDKVNDLAKRWIEFEEWKMPKPGLDEMRVFHIQEIEERCAKEDLASRPYVEMYENMTTKNLEKKCIRKTFYEAVEEGKCEKPCHGYDKFCSNYVATESFDFTELQDALDYKEQLRGYNHR